MQCHPSKLRLLSSTKPDLPPVSRLKHCKVLRRCVVVRKKAIPSKVLPVDVNGGSVSSFSGITKYERHQALRDPLEKRVPAAPAGGGGPAIEQLFGAR